MFLRELKGLSSKLLWMPNYTSGFVIGYCLSLDCNPGSNWLHLATYTLSYCEPCYKPFHKNE